MLKSLREALAQYALGDDDEAAMAAASWRPSRSWWRPCSRPSRRPRSTSWGLASTPARLRGATGFDRIEALRDAVDALYTSDEAKRRFEIMARQVFIRFKALLMEPSALAYAERHDNIEAIYKKLQEKRDTADVTEVLKELHRIVNEAIRAAAPGEDHAEGLTVDLSQIDFAKLRDEFANKVRRKHAALQDIRDVVEKKLAQMLAQQSDADGLLQEVPGDHRRLQPREGPGDGRGDLRAACRARRQPGRRAAAGRGGGAERRRTGAVRPALQGDHQQGGSRASEAGEQVLLQSLQALLEPMPKWTQNSATQAEVKVFILDNLWQSLPRPPFTDDETEAVASVSTTTSGSAAP